MDVDRRTFLRQLGASAAGLLGPADRAGEGRSARGLPAYDPAREDEFWRRVRASYPLREDPLYLNTGGLGPAPQPVLDRVSSTLLALQAHSETGHALLEPARRTFAAFLGAHEDEVCFVRNATEGNSIVAAGLALRPGDEVVFETHAHPGGSFPWLNQARRRGVRVRLFEPDPASAEANVARIRRLVNARTKVVQVSHVTCTTGLVFPVGEIARFCRTRGLWFHVDGAQSIGMMPVNLRGMGCDSYAGSGHKWLGGPPETGVLVIRREQLDRVAPTGVGAYSGEVPRLPGELTYVRAATRHEYGTRSAALVAGLAAAAQFQEEIGPERVAARGRALANALFGSLSATAGITVLTPSPEALRASMVTFRHPRASAEKLFGYLVSRHRLRCRPVTEQGLEAIRVSTHVFNSPADCERVIAAVRASVREL